MKLSSILGLNARFQIYSSPHNSRRGKRIAASKLITKRILKKAGIPIPKRYAKFVDESHVFKFDWSKLPQSFALKPSRGLGGEGIVVVRKMIEVSDKLSLSLRDSDSKEKMWVTTTRKRVTVSDLQLHALDILEGAYSLHNVPDVVYIEEFIGRHDAFKRYAYRGTPDIRVIVFNKIPVMAMLRLPTRESGGRANLHQGAVGVGIDIASGVTTHAVWHGQEIYEKPGTKRKLRGIKIPNWNLILELSVRCQEVSGLGYLGVDIVLHPERGPMVLELNSEPGLDIQIANLSGLRKRLDRIEDLKVVDPEHGVRIAEALFATNFAARVRAEESGVKKIGVFEKVKVYNHKRKPHIMEAKIDTGAWRTSIDRDLAKSLGLLSVDNIITKRKVKTVMGTEKRQVIALTISVAGRKIRTAANVAQRKHLRRQLIVGRRDLTGFTVELKSSS